MSVTQEQLNKLQDILLKEYSVTLPEEELLSEALRLVEFAKTVVRFSLSKTSRLKTREA